MVAFPLNAPDIHLGGKREPREDNPSFGIEEHLQSGCLPHSHGEAGETPTTYMPPR